MYTNHSLSATSIKHQSACSLSVYICIILLRVVEKTTIGKDTREMVEIVSGRAYIYGSEDTRLGRMEKKPSGNAEMRDAENENEGEGWKNRGGEGSR